MRSHPASAQAVSACGTKPVSQCLKFGRKALRQNGRTATEARVRSSSEVSAFQAETERLERDLNPRPDDFNVTCSTQLSYPLWDKRPESNRCLRVFSPTLSMSYILLFLHSAEHETGDRIAPAGISTSPDPWPSEGARQ